MVRTQGKLRQKGLTLRQADERQRSHARKQLSANDLVRLLAYGITTRATSIVLRRSRTAPEPVHLFATAAPAGRIASR